MATEPAILAVILPLASTEAILGSEDFHVILAEEPTRVALIVSVLPQGSAIFALPIFSTIEGSSAGSVGVGVGLSFAISTFFVCMENAGFLKEADVNVLTPFASTVGAFVTLDVAATVSFST